MARTKWSGLAAGVVLLAGCGTDGGTSAEPEPNSATGIAPPSASASSASAGADWTLPTGVFRAVTPKEGTLDLHIEPGRFVIYVYVDGKPELGGEAACVPDDPSTITCTERDGKQVVYDWHGTDDALSFTILSGGEQGDRDVMEPVPWTRVT